MNFSDRLLSAIEQKNSRLCVGLDPNLADIPGEIKGTDSERMLEFNKKIIDAVAEHCAIVKPQSAFYEALGADGIVALKETISYAKSKGLLVLLDAKRGDIASTAEAYAKAAFESLGVDAITLNPYLGIDAISPFLKYPEKGVFVLVRTSNPSAIDFQDLVCQGKPLYEKVGEKVAGWGEKGTNGYSNVGAVVGATYPEQAKILRAKMPNTIFLVPGFGAQGGKAEDLPNFFNSGKKGAIVNSARGIIFAYKKTGGDFAKAAGQAAEKAKNEINGALS